MGHATVRSAHEPCFVRHCQLRQHCQPCQTSDIRSHWTNSNRPAGTSIVAASSSIFEYAARRRHRAKPEFRRSGSDHQRCRDALASLGPGRSTKSTQDRGTIEIALRGIFATQPAHRLRQAFRRGKEGVGSLLWTADRVGQHTHWAGHLPLCREYSCRHRIRCRHLPFRNDTLSSVRRWHGSCIASWQAMVTRSSGLMSVRDVRSPAGDRGCRRTVLNWKHTRG